MRLSILFFAITICCYANPFRIDIEDKQGPLSIEEYLLIQDKLSHIDLSSQIHALYPPQKKWKMPWEPSLAKENDFLQRISKSLKSTLAAPHLIPSQHLISIGKGGPYCIVCYASFNGLYENLATTLPEALEKTGFHGHLLLLIGGFPHPTGKELAYAGVPYCFKIFTMLEAQKQGFSQVLWIDAALLPLKDPTPLFTWLQEKGSFCKMHDSFAKFILPQTRELLLTKTGVDVLKTRYLSTQVFGLDLTTPESQKLIKNYYEMVQEGWPFFSCFPEEYVLTSLIGQNPQHWKAQPFTRLLISEDKLSGNGEKWAEQQGYFFLQRAH